MRTLSWLIAVLTVHTTCGSESQLMEILSGVHILVEQTEELSFGNFTSAEIGVTTSGTFSLKNLTCAELSVEGGVYLVPGVLSASVLAQGTSTACDGTLVEQNVNGSGTIVETPFQIIPGSSTDMIWEVVIVYGEGRRPGVDEDRPLSFETSTCTITIPNDWVILNSSARQSTVSKLLEHHVLCKVAEYVGSEFSKSSIESLVPLIDELVLENRTNDLKQTELDLLAGLGISGKDVLEFGPSAKITFNFLNRLLGSNSSSGEDLRINEFVKSYTQSGSSSFSLSRLPFFDLSVNGSYPVKVEDQVDVFGMDQFSRVNLLNTRPGLQYTLDNTFEIASMGLRFALSIRFTPFVLESSGILLSFSKNVSIQADLFVSVEDIDMELILAAAIDPAQIGNSTFAQMNANLFTCAAPSFYGVNVSSIEVQGLGALSLSVGNISDSILDTLQVNISSLLDSVVVQPLLMYYGPNITRGLNEIVTNLLKESLASAETCPDIQVDDENTKISFQTENANLVRQTINETLSDVDNPEVGINRIIRDVGEFADIIGGALNGGGYAIKFPANFSLNFPIDEETHLIVSLANIGFFNIDTFSAFQPFDAVIGYPVKIHSQIDIAQTQPIGISLDLQVKGNGTLSTDVTQSLRLLLEDVRSEVLYELNVLASRALSLKLNQIYSVPCLLSTLDWEGYGIFLEAMALSIGNLTFRCNTCGDFTTTQQTTMSNSILQVFDTAIPVLVDNLVNNENSMRTLNSNLKEYADTCNAAVYETGNSSGTSVNYSLYTLLSVNSVMFIGLAGIMSCMVLSRHKRVSAQDEIQPSSLSTTEYLPKSLRILTHVSCFMAVVFFIFGISLQSLYLRVVVAMTGGDTVEVDSLYSVSLVTAISQLFDAGSPELGILLALFTGCLPFVWVAVILCCMVLPPKHLSESMRGTWITILSLVAKWTVVAVLLMAVLVALFNMKIVNPAFPPFSSSDVTVAIALVCDLGLLSFIFGYVFLLISIHSLGYLHRCVVNPTNVSGTFYGVSRDKVRAMKVQEILKSHIFHSNSGYKIKLTTGATVFLLGSVCVALGLLGASLVVSVAKFEFLGVGGLGLQTAGKATQEFSILSLLSGLQNEENSIGQSLITVTMQILLVLCVVVLPFLQQIGLVLMLLSPLTLRQLRWATGSTSLFSTWTSMEVMVLAIVFGVFYPNTFLQLAIGDVCADLNVFLAKWVEPFNLLSSSKCVEVQGQLLGGIVVPLVASLLCIANTLMISSMAKQAVFDRERILEASLEENDFGCWHSILQSRLGMLKSLGIVLVKKTNKIAEVAVIADELQFSSESL